MRALLTSIGTDGDILPYVGLGAVLKSRGHEATLLASEQYEGLAKRHGLDFAPIVSTKENNALFHHPDFWDPIKTAPLASSWGVRFIERQYELLKSLNGPDCIQVANPGVFAARLLHETAGTPLVSLVLQPWMLPSLTSPPIMPRPFPRRAPRFIWKLFWRLLDLAAAVMVGPTLNPIRKKLNLKPMRRIVRDWLSPQLAIALFPAWFGPPQPDWPPQLKLASFPLFDGSPQNFLAAEVKEFCSAGNPPIVFTFGTGMAHPARFFQMALQSCEMLNARAIFLTKFRDQLPHNLPPNVIHCPFAPFKELFPLCGALVHHGGIGTASEALAAGLPQLVRPICFDQMDNGERVRKLGAGDWFKQKNPTAQDMAQALKPMLTPECKATTLEVSRKINRPDGLKTAASLVENLFNDPSRLPSCCAI